MASAAFGRLHKNVWDRRGITTETKIKVYKAVVLTTMLYGCESWTVYQCHARKMNHFHSTSLRKILGIKWQDMLPDTEVLTRANLKINLKCVLVAKENKIKSDNLEQNHSVLVCSDNANNNLGATWRKLSLNKYQPQIIQSFPELQIFSDIFLYV